MRKQQAAIVIPVYKAEMDWYELISFQQAKAIFKKHPLILVAPESLSLENYEQSNTQLKVERFEAHHFENIEGYNRLLLSAAFYKRFKKYRYILIYQLDAFVFRDELNEWINQPYDYIGAPWFANWALAGIDSPITGMGNGGFSLRKTKSAYRVLKRMEWYISIRKFWFNYYLQAIIPINNIRGIINTMLRIKAFDKFTDLFSAQCNEDYFWSVLVCEAFSDYNPATVEKAISFSFELNPRILFDLNHQKLPFGCHAWFKYDIDFFRPHIESFGFKIAESNH